MKGQQHDTVRRILDTATEVFAEVGFAGARVDEIAKRAGVNKATIYYHLGGKEELYAEVLRNLLGDRAEQAISKIQQISSPEEQLRIYIHNIAAVINQNPYIAPIMLREVATGGRHMSKFIVQNLVRLISTLIEILEEGERQGIFISTIPFVVHFMIVGSIIFLQAKSTLMACNIAFPEFLEVLNHQNLSENIAEEVEKLVLRAIKR
jgi:AcrR family transcriptional regulator